jgi:hypothetical protein
MTSNVVPADDDLVERTAKAICQAKTKRHYGIERGADEAWTSATDYARSEWLADARAAIASLSSELARCRNALEGWQPIDDNCPHACHVLASRFDESFGEWIYGVVASPPPKPFTHFRALPEPPALNPIGEEGAREP